jgi:hypothetical protein
MSDLCRHCSKPIFRCEFVWYHKTMEPQTHVAEPTNNSSKRGEL